MKDFIEFLSKKNTIPGLFALNIIFLFFPMLNYKTELFERIVSNSKNITAFLTDDNFFILGFVLLLSPIAGLAVHFIKELGKFKKMSVIVLPIIMFISLIIVAIILFKTVNEVSISGGLGYWLTFLVNGLIIFTPSCNYINGRKK